MCNITAPSICRLDSMQSEDDLTSEEWQMIERQSSRNCPRLGKELLNATEEQERRPSVFTEMITASI
jgi:hypothetical protein